jgi:hypothetical protein
LSLLSKGGDENYFPVFDVIFRWDFSAHDAREIPFLFLLVKLELQNYVNSSEL